MPDVTRWRVRAALVDLALVTGWAVVVAAVTVPLYVTGLFGGLRQLTANLLGSLLVVVPVVVGLALLEGGRYEASPGKQWCGLRVRRADGARLGFARSLARNAVKVAPVWLAGHAAVLAWASAAGPVGADVWILTSIAVLLPLGYLATAWLDGGRAPHDLLAGSLVVATAPGRRIAAD